MTPLDERRKEAVGFARELSQSAGVLLTVAAELCTQSRELCIVAKDIRHAHARSRFSLAERDRQNEPWFSVYGLVDGVPKAARFWPDRLDFDLEVLRRAQVVVAMGEEFALPDRHDLVVSASLAGPPIAVLLTVMRAFSRVISIDLSEKIFGRIEWAKE